MKFLRQLLPALLFPLSLATAVAAPEVSSLLPADGATLSSFTSLSVTFTEPVTGIDPSDLEVGGAQAAAVSGSGAGPWVFSFSQPVPGTVAATWDIDHGIAGIGTGAFVPGTGWSFTLTDIAPPTVGNIPTSVSGQEMKAIAPQPGSLVSSLTSTAVTFSEPVSGVDASDLLINGTPATSVTGQDAGPWVFQFSSPAAGPVNFTWNASTGIKDDAGNAFSGTPWQVVLGNSAGSPAVTEFLTSNAGLTSANSKGIRDENFDLSGYVEITNQGSASVDLLGWSLTNNADDPARWVFPSRTLAAGASLVIWTSGKDRKPAAANGHLHTSFSLNPNGGYLALFPPDYPSATPASVFAAYPPQRYDYSFRPQAGDGALRYFAPPSVTQPNYTLPTATNLTPPPPAVPTGTANPASPLVSIAPDPEPSVKRGYFSEAFPLVLSSTDPSATVRYTLDGSPPGAASPAYTTPLTVVSTTILRMAAFDPSLVPSNTVTHSYIFPDNVVSQPSPPYDNPARTNDDTNPPLPEVGGTALPIAWGSGGTNGLPGLITNLSAGQIPADYGMDPKVYADPTRYADDGSVDPAGATNAERISRSLRTLPMLSVVLRSSDMFGPAGIYPNASESNKPDLTKPCSLELLEADGTTAFHVDCGIDLHGNASRAPHKNPKHGFTLKFKGRFGSGKLQAALFPDSPAHDFDKIVLRGDFNSHWLHWDGGVQRPKGTRIRDAWCKDTFRDMGRMAGHHRYANLFINGIFWGTYDLTEDQTEDFGANYFGGKKDDFDVIDQGVLKNGTWTAYYAMKSILGWRGSTFTTAPAVPGAAFTNSQMEDLRQYLDVPWFIDYMIHHFFTGHMDWGTTSDYNKNWYLIRPPGGTIKYLPWDQENLLWGVGDNRVTGAAYPPSAIHPRVKSNAEYRLLFADRVHRHLVAPDGALQPSANIARLGRWTSIMNADAMCLESARWGDYRYKVHPYSSGTFSEVYSWNGKWFEINVLRSNSANTNNWTAEVRRLTTSYFPARTNAVLSQLRSAGLYPALNAPQFVSESDGAPTGSRPVSTGFQLRMQQPLPAPSGTVNGGTIFYTTDGNDPRVAYTSGGDLTPTALAYTGPLTLATNTTVKARTLNGSAWSALMEATFTVGPPLPAIGISEIHYNARGAQGGSAAEFIEILNTASSPVDLSTWSFQGIDFIFPVGFVLRPGGIAVVASNDNPAVFAAQYPGVLVAGYYKDSLSNGGERISLLNAAGQRITSVEYDDTAPWPTAADGQGYSLENIHPDRDPQDPGNWRASTTLKGTPGTVAPSPPAPSVQISEFLARNQGSYSVSGATPDFVELHNPGTGPVDLGGWILSLDGTAVLTLPPATSLADGARLVIPCSGSLPSGLQASRPLPDGAGLLILTNAALLPVDSVRYGPQAPDLSFSRIGGAWTLSAPSPGTDGTPAALAPPDQLRLNEWLANPVPGKSDWVELYNLHPALPVVLTGLHLGNASRIQRITPPAAIGPQSFSRLHAGGSTRGDYLALTLSAAGGTLRLLDANGGLLDTQSYPGQSEGISEGRLPDGSGPVTTLPFPSPTASNYALLSGTPLLNEVLSVNHTGDNTPWATRAGWIEIRNPGPSAMDLAGWSLGGNSPAWTFPAGTTLAPGAELAVWCDPASPRSLAPGTSLNCGLDLGSGPDIVGAVQLVSPAGQIADRLTYGWQIPDLSLGRNPDNSWSLTQTPTRGPPNSSASPLASTPVLINEWLADPGSLLPADFIELHNPATLPASVGGLFLTDDPSEPRLRQWRIPVHSFIAPGRQIYFHAGSSGNAAVVSFGLGAGGDHLRLGSDDAAASLIDRVSFGAAPATVSSGRIPDGQPAISASLAPTPGMPNSGGPGPVFVTQPRDAAGPPGSRLILTAAANAGTLQWYRNGTLIPDGVTGTLTLDPLTLSDDAVYTAVATNGAAVTVSLPARVMVLTTYSDWAAATAAGPGADDPDKDGVVNFMEFISGTDPHRPDSAVVTPGPVNPLPLTELTLDFPLNRRAAYTSLEGRMSTTLDSWQAAVPSAKEVLEETVDGNLLMRWHFPVPADSGPRHFLRLYLVP